MKKQILFTLFVFVMSIVGLKAQTITVDEATLQPKKFEAGVDVVNTIFLSTPILHFDYLFHEDMSVGARVILGLKENTARAIQPNFKWYFWGNSFSTTKYASGLFLEVNAIAGAFPMTTANVDFSSYDVDVEHSSKGAFGMGMGLGYKYVNRSNWSLQISSVASRLINTKGDGKVNEVYGTFLVTIAKRF